MRPHALCTWEYFMKQLTHKQFMRRQAKRRRYRRNKRMEAIAQDNGSTDLEVIIRFRQKPYIYRRASEREAGRMANKNLVKVHGVWMPRAKHTINITTYLENGTDKYGNEILSECTMSFTKHKRIDTYKQNTLEVETSLGLKETVERVEDAIKAHFNSKSQVRPHKLYYVKKPNGEYEYNANGKRTMVAKYFTDYNPLTYK